MKIENVLSLFDGASMAQVALKRSKIKYRIYYASEINPDAIAITQFNHPNTIQVGDVRNLNPEYFKKISIIFAGFPCTDFSIMGRRRGMVTKESIKVTSLEQYLELKESGFEFEGQSYLFWEMLRVIKGIKKFNPEVRYLLENVTKIGYEWFEIIVNELGYPYTFNASILTTQNRDRHYWTDIPQLPYPEPTGLTLESIIPGAISTGVHGVSAKSNPHLPNPKNGLWPQKRITRDDGKVNCLTCSGSTSQYIVDGKIFTFTPEHREAIQTLDIGYTKVNVIRRGKLKELSATARNGIIGNGWSVDTVVPLLRGLTIE
jgi:hypothetical protein